ncbi:MAG: peptidase M28 [Lentisphaerae bacterium RIFOXYB12_FULL_65_16]|nr:MAG: peptidase M28 [Lentisphaerae bacterium RIFOXYA12_64_32]OGV88472.1 MAG: peptidase M28 [Lentisphaerae bacterium RIFOXYB12_FULL_65_16]
MDQATLDMLKELTEVHGAPGFEEEVQSLIRKHLPPGTDVEYDRLGSIVCRKAGTAPAPRIMLPGHMDEIGFMVKLVTKEGFIKFAPLGGWSDQVLLSQRVVIHGRKGKVTGLVGSKPPHLMEADERNKVVKKDDMFIDVGAKSDKDVERRLGIRIGDPICPESAFGTLGNAKFLVGKAWDDRVGCGLFISVLRALQKQPHPNSVYGVGTVQEEVGTRGAKTSAEVVNPDICIVLESGIAADTPGIKPEDAQGKLGKGPILYILDGGMIGHRRLRDFVIDTATKKKIPYQLSVLMGGATDGRPIHLHAKGVPTLFLGVPARYIHCHTGVIHADDYDSTVKLLVETIKRLDAKALQGILGRQ